MSSKLIVLSLLLVAVHLAACASLRNVEERIWVFDSDRDVVMDPSQPDHKRPQITCYGWYCKRTERGTAICEGKDFSGTPNVDYTCRIGSMPFSYKLAKYSITCNDFNKRTSDQCYLTVHITDAD